MEFVLMYKRVKDVLLKNISNPFLVFWKERDDEINCWLGNPGDKYVEPKHNVGFMLVDQMAKPISFSHDNSFRWRLNILNGEKVYFRSQTVS